MSIECNADSSSDLEIELSLKRSNIFTRQPVLCKSIFFEKNNISDMIVDHQESKTIRLKSDSISKKINHFKLKANTAVMNKSRKRRHHRGDKLSLRQDCDTTYTEDDDNNENEDLIVNDCFHTERNSNDITHGFDMKLKKQKNQSDDDDDDDTDDNDCGNYTNVVYNDGDSSSGSSSGTKDEDTNDDEINVTKRQKLKISPSSMSITSSSSASSSKPTTIRRMVTKKNRKTTNKNSATNDNLYNQYIIDSANNKSLYRALILISPDSIIEAACQNINNFHNLEMLEWSELILIQLCTLRKEIDIKILLQWPAVQLFVEHNQWSIEVTQNIKRFIGHGPTLINLLKINHNFKVSIHKMKNTKMFICTPLINYKCLLNYRITPDIIHRPYGNILPMKFKKLSIPAVNINTI
ncbi:hypothetical protein DiNV_CH01M_ORF37 [Drosophila innubila nudivirus]|uniref:Uncharacterized protein n=1 Tax=Drosophila innubila nudivirus TaxID=2057187 RepID=A0A2H4UX76_9VIRU|nr:hypothetical protein DiNV_CH01M_ORF37 [Drosophila innubila nudivirus]ATZ81518.1 hypothetical protein DiNV_CH01M_ORF37 [Drosophila innubila nudivirus]